MCGVCPYLWEMRERRWNPFIVTKNVSLTLFLFFVSFFPSSFTPLCSPPTKKGVTQASYNSGCEWTWRARTWSHDYVYMCVCIILYDFVSFSLSLSSSFPLRLRHSCSVSCVLPLAIVSVLLLSLFSLPRIYIYMCVYKSGRNTLNSYTFLALAGKGQRVGRGKVLARTGVTRCSSLGTNEEKEPRMR